jgi:hypothetical protein
MIIEIYLVGNGRLFIPAGGEDGDGTDHGQGDPGSFSAEEMHAIGMKYSYGIWTLKILNLLIFQDIFKRFECCKDRKAGGEQIIFISFYHTGILVLFQ